MESDHNPKVLPTKMGIGMMMLSPALAVLPFLLGTLLSRVFCGPDANEGNCGWAALPWFMFFTIPAAVVMFVTGFVLLIVSLFKKSTN